MASIDDGWVMGYDIFRDGVLIQEQLDANHFFDGTLEPSSTYNYQVVAVDDKGNRSQPSETTLTTDNIHDDGDEAIFYFNDFEGVVGPEWSNRSTDTTPLGARTFLGQFSNDTVSLALNGLPPHSTVQVTFELFVIESWDGNNRDFGPDVWEFSAGDDQALLKTTFSNAFDLHTSFWQAYPDTHPGGYNPGLTGAAEIDTLGYADLSAYSGANDSIYRLAFNIPHSAASLFLNFSGSNLEGVEDESWGIDNIAVSVLPKPEDDDPDASPTMPGNLTSSVYSSHSAELFWMASIDDGWVMGYNIFRDGVLIKEQLDANSFFDTNLEPATTYQYSVVAVDDRGNLSVPSEVELTTSDGPPLSPDTLVAPQIERIEVYSGTAAELFWRQPPPGSLVARVEVSRDNLVLGTTDGTSFFDDSRSPGVDYKYTLVAIAADGRRSDVGASEPGAGGDGLDVIRPDNAVRLLAAVFDAYRGKPWGDIVYALPGFSYTPNSNTDEEETVICDNGGTVTVRLFSVPAGRASSQFGFDFAFDDCQEGDTLFDGQVDIFSGRWGGDYVRSSGITVTRSTETIRYSGTVFDEPAARAFSTSGPVNFERSAADGTLYSLTGAISNFQHGYSPFVPFATVNLSGGFSVALDRSGGVTLHAETPDALIRPPTQDPETGAFEPLPEDWTFVEGSLRISAPDSSSVLLEANNGDNWSARLTVIDTAGESTSFDQQWSVWQENLRFD